MNNCKIRPPKPEDLEQLTAFMNEVSSESGIMISYQGMSFSLEEEKRWLDKTLKGIAEKETVYLLVEVEGRVVGTCDVKRQGNKMESHTGVFGLIIAKDYRGQGLGYKLAQAVIEKAKNDLSWLEIITLKVFEENVSARNLYQKLGFQQYGLLPNGIINSKGKTQDRILMYKEVQE